MTPDSPHFAHCLKALHASALFSQLSDEVLQDMLLMFRYEPKYRGDTAISPNETTDRLYLIISGHAKVSVYHPDSGREHILFLLGPGDGFDLISLLDGDWHEAVATALDDMEVIFTTVQQARSWLDQHPDFNRAFLPYLGKQMHALANQVGDLSLYDTEARLARLILRNVTSDTVRNELRLINDLSQETLAAMIGSVRIVVTRHLQKWKQQGILSGKRRQRSVVDIDALLTKAETQYEINSKHTPP